MMKKVLAFGLLSLFLYCNASSQQIVASDSSISPFFLNITPRFSLPLGRDASVYSYGGGTDIGANYPVRSLPWLFLGGKLGYSFVPLRAVTSVSLIDASLTAGFRLALFSRLSLSAFGNGGYFYAFANNGAGGGANPVLAGGADISWAITPSFALGLGAIYRNYLGLYNDLGLDLGLSYRLPPRAGSSKEPTAPQVKPQPLNTAPKTQNEPKGKGLFVKDLALGNVFPVLHAYYDTNPLGKMILLNTEKSPMTDINVSLIVRQFMDAPKNCATIAELKPGEQKDVDLFALFKNSIFETKQSTKVPAEIAISYTIGGKTLTESEVETLRIYDCNALTWDDTNKAAAFVMPKEPAVLMMSNQINSFVKAKRNRAIDGNLQTAMALHDALRLLNIAYVSPPLTSYTAQSENKTAVDSVKFPLETLQYRWEIAATLPFCTARSLSQYRSRPPSSRFPGISSWPSP